ncbi:MAG TPA: AMP-binding protein [Solirubrobacteraceae bacterium]|jgi:putative long chain acyl-CoA synthase|nr:AMP-binding protein [Solirubrobacteraceae bacterium]
MDLLPKTITAPIGRLGAAAQNALEVARFGGLDTDEQPSPYEVVAEHRVYKLRRYYRGSDGDRGSNGDGQAGAGPAILLVPPMMLAAEIYDVSPATSAVTLLHENGVDPWVVDFGAPEREEGGLERTLADHVLAISDAVDRVREATGRDVHLGGYSQGGMFCYQVAAYRRNDGLGSLITFGSPVDTRLGMPFGLPEELASGLAGLIADVFRGSALPAWFSRNGFLLLDPVKSIRSRIEFVMQLHDREALLPREGQRRFLEGGGWVAWPGPALAEFVGQFIAHNRMLEGGFVIGERLLSLSDIRCPILSVVGTVDEIAPPAGVRAIRQAAPRADVYELALRAGHFGLVVGSTSNQVTWPTVAAWTQWRDGGGELPEGVSEVPDEPAGDLLAQRDRIQNRVGYGLELAGAVGNGIARSMLGGARRTTRSMRELAREAAGALPQLARLEQIQPSTRVSLGLLVEERMQRGANDTMFLYEDRAYSTTEVNARIDNVVRGLISIGVRQGEHVGVLMGSRPSALAVVTALSRLGAVAVMLRPDGNTAREASLGAVRRIIADPERAAQAAGLGTVHTFVLGGGGGPRDLEVPLTTDMEQIDPRTVTLPAWYRPNPGRASDLAFILFTGEGDFVRMSRITNRRWAASAFGTASSSAFSGGDTVYSVTPLYHPSGLMMSIGGAIAGGARLAMASQFDPTTFWDEVRRYGVTVTSYTWTLLHDLVAAPPNAGERGHSLRLFIGSGMPRGLWRRVQERFSPARVVEFYASTETGAILVNLRAAKPGAMGRPLPGTPEVRVAAYDQESEQLLLGDGGFVRRCKPDEVGLLVARARPSDTSVTPMRGVFSRDDAWLSTGDLFRRDADGDYWRLDGVYDVIHTADGPVLAAPIRDALSDVPAVDLAVAYGLRPDGADELAVAAVTLCPGQELSAEALSRALGEVPEGHRPAVVRVIDEMPVTTWFRPVTRPLREAGLPEPDDGRVWYLDRGGKRYRPLTAAARTRLSGR